MSTLLLAVFLILHGLIHLGYLAPAPADPNMPFTLNRSWLLSAFGVPDRRAHSIGVGLSIVSTVGFLLAGLATLNIIVPQMLWLPLTITAAGASLTLLTLYWDSWLVLGVTIDLILIFALLLQYSVP